MTDEEIRLTKLESKVEHVCNSLDRFVAESREDRKERKQRDEKIDQLLHGKDNDSPGLLVELDRLKGFEQRFHHKLTRVWVAISGLVTAIAGGVVTWVLSHIGGKP